MQDTDSIAVARDALIDGRVMDATRILVEGGFDLNSALKVLSHDGQPRVGDILVASWGYEQTNIDFYQVVAVTDKGSCRIRHINKTVVEARTYTDIVAPVRDSFCDNNPKGDLKRPSKSAYGIGYRVKLSSYSSAHVWDGEPCSQTGSGYGH